MANFNTHVSVGFVASGILAMTAYKAGVVNNDMLLACTLAGTLGSILPDIDLAHSKPAQLGFKLFSVLGAFLMVMFWSREHSLVEMFVTWGVGFVAMQYGVFALYSKLTVHRGIVHSIPYMALLSVLMVHLCYYLLDIKAQYSWFVGLFVFLGALIHLTLDEIYSVDMFNAKLKRSFGTALKVFEIKKWHFYLVTYTLLVIAVLLAPSSQPMMSKLTDSMTWLILSKSVFPVL